MLIIPEKLVRGKQATLQSPTTAPQEPIYLERLLIGMDLGGAMAGGREAPSGMTILGAI